MENFVFVLYLTIIVLNRKEQRQEGRKKIKSRAHAFQVLTPLHMLENGNAKIWVCLGGNMDTRIIKFEKKNYFLKRAKKTTKCWYFR